MDYVLSSILGSMQADMDRMDRVAMNLANLQTPGYKREVATTAPFAARVQAGASAVHADPEPGTLKATGQALDLALSGPGWFEVSTPGGLAYTRQGSLRLDAAGRLVTQRGFPVMGLGGEIVLTSEAPTIDAAGRLFDSGSTHRGESAPVAQLKIVQFARGAAMQRVGDGLLVVRSASALVPDGEVQVRQGFLENSNVSHMREMVALLEAVRHLETMQKVALGYDEMLSTSIRKLGDTA